VFTLTATEESSGQGQSGRHYTGAGGFTQVMLTIIGTILVIVIILSISKLYDWCKMRYAKWETSK
jgi:hypothetical protein